MNAKVVLLLGVTSLVPCMARAESPVTFDQKDSSLQIQIGGKPFASYVWQDRNVLRPYFAHVHAPNGKQVTRNHPPVEGKDATDHAAMHPGVWLAFGDLGGADFWRNKATVKHVEFVERPNTTKDGGNFAVKNRYVSGEKTVCEETCRISITVRPWGYLIDWTSEFTGPEDFSFGDQEEMGLGVRVATPLTVKNGGHILNSDGSKNEKQVWGKQADWCDYSCKIDGQPVGVTLVPDPKNFRRSWFHARDYGVLVANSFVAVTGGRCKLRTKLCGRWSPVTRLSANGEGSWRADSSGRATGSPRATTRSTAAPRRHRRKCCHAEDPAGRSIRMAGCRCRPTAPGASRP